MYINGAMYRTDTGKPVPYYVSRINAWLGKSEWGDSPFNGYMDEFRIYNSVLQQSDVEALYNYVAKSSPSLPSESTCKSVLGNNNILTIIIIKIIVLLITF